LPALAPAVDDIALGDPVFISDLHLSASHRLTLDTFLRFLGQLAPNHRELVVLGDLFEYWAGDDDLSDPFAQDVAGALQGLAARGARVFLMHGNRDLLLGSAFARAAGATLLVDPTVATVGDRRVLLSHGDAYCTRDEDYQRFRRQARDPVQQQAFLAQPLAARKMMIGQVRAHSEAGKQMKAADIMDVTPAAIETALRAAGVTCMIHGHTHRPAQHGFLLDKQPAQRIVLPDWDYETAPSRGGYLRVAGGEFIAEDLRP
jgi:UDP-2,3-diacylglucosamine hydrolase